MSTVRKTIRIYWQHIAKRRAQFVLICAITALATIVGQVMLPFVASLMLDKLAAGQTVLSVFARFLVFYAILLGLELMAFRLMVFVLWKFEISIMQELIERVFRHLMHQSNRFHTNHFGGALVSQANKFVNAFERLSDSFFFDMLTSLVYYVSIIMVLGFRAPLYAAILTAGILLFASILVWRSRILQPYNVAEATAESDSTAQLADSITNISAIKSYAHEDTEESLFTARVTNWANRSFATMRVSIKNDIYFNSITSSLGWLAIATAIVAVVKFNAPLGTVLLIVSYTGNALRRLWDMSRTTRNLNRAFGDAHDMTKILNLRPEVEDKTGAKALQPSRGDIIFKKVSFAYPEQPGQPLFQNFDLHIKPGEKVGLVGHSGGGKTTLTKLLLRFADIDSGQILIDGQEIAAVTQKSLRQVMSYVPQEPIMFHRSLFDNIRYGRLGATDKEVFAVSKMANAHAFIEQLPKKYETLVGERGTKLSGGQRQRVAIARAMLKNAPILLLDEATSALDSESEQLIQDALWKLMEGRTTIAIAHRLSTIQRMDRIIVLEEGQIVEEGSHKELLKKNGLYARLWAHQSGGFLED